MSYGVIVSKTGQMSVETLEGDATPDAVTSTAHPARADGLGEADSDLTLDRFQSVWGTVWVPGRITLTRLHLNFIPSRGGRGMSMMDINLRDVQAVELSGGRMSRQIGLRTARHLARIRVMGAPGIAAQLAELAEAARQIPTDPSAGSSAPPLRREN